VELSPEEAGLIGCWQFILVWRQRQYLRQGKVIKESEEYAFYACSLAKDEHSAEELAGFIRGHWNAVEIGSHYRRDVSLGEDASQISQRSTAQVMAALRNAVLGLFELQKDRGKTKARYFPSWTRLMSASAAIRLVKGI
jgi:predicted transposase YbfD/YdcC